MGKRKAWRFGYLAGASYSNYRKLETQTYRRLVRHGLPKRVCRIGVLAVRALIVAFLTYLAFWIICGALVWIAVTEYLSRSGHQSSGDPDFEGFDSDALFPDPYSARYINDPAFSHDD